MLLKVFSHNSFINSFILLILLIVLALIGATQSGEVLYSAHLTYFDDWIVKLESSYYTLSVILAILILFFEAIYINRIVIINKLGYSITLVPGLLFVLFSTMILGVIHLNPILISSFFLTLSMTFLNYSFKMRNAVSNVFSSGLWLGVGILFYPPLMFFIIAMLIGFSSLRRFRMVEVFRFLIGILVPLFLVGVYAFTQNEFMDYINITFVDSLGIGLALRSFNFQLQEVVMLVSSLIMILISVFSVFSYTTKKPVPSQHMISIQYWYMVFAGVSAIFTKELYVYHLLLLVIPLSIFMSESITSMKNKRIAELTLWFILILSVILQFDLIS